MSTQKPDMLLPDDDGCYLILDPDLRILDASPDYLRATLLWHESIGGRYMFDVFPDNPALLRADGVRNLQASLREAVRMGEPQAMPEQRYDVRDRINGESWVEVLAAHEHARDRAG